MENLNREVPFLLTMQTNACSSYTLVIEDGKVSYAGKRQEWEDYLYALQMLPDRLLNHYSFRAATPDEKTVYKRTVKLYTTLSQWIDYLVPGTKPVDPELFLTDKVMLKPRAYLSKSILSLATELLPRCPELQENYKTPADIWYNWELELLDTFFWNSGLLIGKSGVSFSKDQAAESHRRIAENLEEQSLDWSKASHQELRMDAALYTMADNVARNDETFRWSESFGEYIKRRRGWANAVRNPSFEFLYLENGKLLPNGRKAKRKKK